MPATPASAPASTGPSGDLPARPCGVPGAGPGAHGDPRLAGGAGRPHHAGGCVQPRWWATTTGSCSSRSSTASAGAAGRSSGATRSATLTARGRSVVATGTLPDGVPLDRGILAADRGGARRVAGPHPRRPAAAARRADGLPRLRRRPRGRGPARRARRRPRPPRRRHVGDRPARRLRPLAPAGHPHRQRPRRARACPTTSSTVATTRRSLASTSWPRTAPARSTSPSWSPRTPQDELPEVRSTMGSESYWPGRRGGQGAHPGRRHLPGGRWRSASTSTSAPSPSTCTACCARSTRARTCTSSASPG